MIREGQTQLVFEFDIINLNQPSKTFNNPLNEMILLVKRSTCLPKDKNE